MKIIEKDLEGILIHLSKDEISLITSALGEIPNILDVDDCETRTGYDLEQFNELFVLFDLIDDR
ncbi:hypothetical protein [Lonepinella sp. MS14436]|uniref:hypothetical protein n=1 Tax=Lonepinella sp. MS14436 TaxID=3003619 RepID=UPI0036D96D47